MYEENSNKSNKGDYAEELIIKTLEKQNFQFLVPLKDGKAHLCDGLAYRHNSRTENQKEDIKVFWYDVKAKARMNKFNSTGINESQLNHYKELNEINTFYLFFVDEMTGTIYGGSLNKLMKAHIDTVDTNIYPLYKTFGGIKMVLFSLEKMTLLRALTEEEQETLKGLNSRSYGFTA